MISVEEARGRILASLTPTTAETLALPEAWGRVLAQPVHARVTQPPADVSAMDGYAVRAGDAVAGLDDAAAVVERVWAEVAALGERDRAERLANPSLR